MFPPVSEAANCHDDRKVTTDDGLKKILKLFTNLDQDATIYLPSQTKTKDTVMCSPLKMRLLRCFLPPPTKMWILQCAPSQYCNVFPPLYLSVVLFITPRERMTWNCVPAHNQIAEEAVIARKVDLHPLPQPGKDVEQHTDEEPAY